MFDTHQGGDRDTSREIAQQKAKVTNGGFEIGGFEEMGPLTTGEGVVRQSRCFDQEQPPGVVVVSTFVAGINPRGCRGCHLDCQAILARSTPSDTTSLGSSRY